MLSARSSVAALCLCAFAAAQMLGERVGSLESGKDADVLVVRGDPADSRSAVDRVFIEGPLVCDAERDSRRW